MQEDENRFTTADLIKAVPSGIWFDVPELDINCTYSNARSRLKGIKEFKHRKLPKPGSKKASMTEFYIAPNDLQDLRKRISQEGRIIPTKIPKQVITKHILSEVDVLLNRFMGVGC